MIDVDRVLDNEDLQKKAFEIYYKLGSRRNLQEVENRTNIDFDILNEWSELYDWDGRIAARVKDLETAFEEHYQKRSKDIRNNLVKQITRLLGELDQGPLGLPFSIRTPSDLRVVAQAYETLVRANKTALSTAGAGRQEAIKSWSELADTVPDDDEIILNEDEGHL